MLIKKIITAGILFVILATSVAPVGVRAQLKCSDGTEPVRDDLGRNICDDGKGGIIVLGGRATTATEVVEGTKNAISGVAEAAMYNFVTEKIAGFIGWTLQRISGLFLLLSGLLFDTVVRETVVEMSQNLSSKDGIGLSINQAWKTLRDIANMVFIFVLLYTAFNAMFTNGVGNVGRNIAWIIIIALVINFSLFFSKVVIDASNVVSLGFYKAIANTGSYDLTIENKTASGVLTSTQNFNGISAGYMRMLGIHSFWSFDTNTENIHGAQNVLIMGILTAVFVLVAAVILFITSIMFVSRFVILIFIMILSPVAFVMYIIPGMSGKFNEWWKALINQAFFAPVFFALTWVVFKVGSTMSALSDTTQNGVNWTQIVSAPSAMMGLVINYFIIIGLSIFALTAAKKMASSVAGFTAVSTALGGAAVGGAAILGRNTIGRGAQWAQQNKAWRDKASETTGVGRYFARAGLWTAGKTSESSFDMRSIGGTGAGKALGLDKGMDILGKAGGKGGFSKAVEEKAKAKADYAKKYYGQTDGEKDEFERRKEEEKDEILKTRVKKEREAREARKKAEENRSKYMEDQTRENSEKIKDLNNKKKGVEREMKNTTDEEKKKEYRMELNSINTEIMNEREAKKELEKKIERDDQDYQKLKEDADEAKKVAEKAKSQLGKKDIDDDELSKELQAYKNAYKDRLENFAKRVEGESPASTTIGAVVGGLVGSVPGSIIGGVIGNKIGGTMKKFNWAGNKSAARSIRKLKSEKSAKDKAFDAVKEMQKAEEESSGGGAATAQQNTANQPATGPTPPQATT